MDQERLERVRLLSYRLAAIRLGFTPDEAERLAFARCHARQRGETHARRVPSRPLPAARTGEQRGPLTP